MRHHRSMTSILIGLLAVAACGGPPPRRVPVPEEIESARQDSISRAQEKEQPATQPKADTTEGTGRAHENEQPATQPKADTTDGTGKDALDVSIEGEESEFSDYYRNVVTQIRRYFHWTGTSLPVADVYFVINRDGSVSDIRLVRRSGNAAFDGKAISAIEQAGKRHAFGPLPKGLPGDSLPVRLTFEPPH